MGKAGITRLADITYLDKIGIPVVSASRPCSHSVSISMGKGVDLFSAYASALMEGIEFYQAENQQLAHTAESTPAALTREQVAFQTQGLRLKDEELNHSISETSVKWCEALDILTDKKILVPYESVNTNYKDHSSSNIFQSSTNGLASGNSHEEATVHAICEIIERDAICIWEQSPSRIKFSGLIDNSTITCVDCLANLEKISAAGLLCRILDLTSNIGVSVFMVVLIDTDNLVNYPAKIVYGSGCHLRKDIALSRAITEAAQVRLTTIIGSRDDIPGAAYIDFKPDFGSCYEYLVLPQKADYAIVPDYRFDSIKEELHYLKDVISEKASSYPELNKIIRLSLDTPELNVPTVKVLIPFLENPYDEIDYLPGPRLEEAKLKWKSLHL